MNRLTKLNFKILSPNIRLHEKSFSWLAVDEATVTKKVYFLDHPVDDID